MERKRIVFLDIDGVLFDMSENDFYPNAIALLDRLCLEVGAKIVISSSWRIMYGLEDTIKRLNTAGLKTEIIDATPYEQEWHRNILITKPRGEEILQWIMENPPVHRYVILDDKKIKGHDGNFVQTDEFIGLTEKDINKSLEVLKS